jgi:hypothetical protein
VAEGVTTTDLSALDQKLKVEEKYALDIDADGAEANVPVSIRIEMLIRGMTKN